MENKKTLYQRLVEGGISGNSMDHWRSDLYVPVTPATTAIIEAYYKENGMENLTTKFRSQIEGDSFLWWYDCPFAYDLFWEKCLSSQASR